MEKTTFKITTNLNGLQLLIVSLNDSLRKIDEEDNKNAIDVKSIRDQAVEALKAEIKRRDPDLENLQF